MSKKSKERKNVSDLSVDKSVSNIHFNFALTLLLLWHFK